MLVFIVHEINVLTAVRLITEQFRVGFVLSGISLRRFASVAYPVRGEMFYIPFSYNDYVIHIGNISDKTTCADVIAAILQDGNAVKKRSNKKNLLHRTAEKGQWRRLASDGENDIARRDDNRGNDSDKLAVYEEYRGVERLLPAQTSILSVWQSWKRHVNDVTFTIRPLPFLRRSTATAVRHLIYENWKLLQPESQQPLPPPARRGKRRQCRDKDAKLDRYRHIHSATSNKLARIVRQQRQQLRNQQKRLATLDIYIESATSLQMVGGGGHHCWDDDYNGDELLSNTYWFDDMKQTLSPPTAGDQMGESLKLYECIIAILDALIEQENSINTLLHSIVTANQSKRLSVNGSTLRRLQHARVIGDLVSSVATSGKQTIISHSSASVCQQSTVSSTTGRLDRDRSVHSRPLSCSVSARGDCATVQHYVTSTTDGTCSSSPMMLFPASSQAASSHRVSLPADGGNAEHIKSHANHQSVSAASQQQQYYSLGDDDQPASLSVANKLSPAKWLETRV